MITWWKKLWDRCSVVWPHLPSLFLLSSHGSLAPSRPVPPPTPSVWTYLATQTGQHQWRQTCMHDVRTHPDLHIFAYKLDHNTWWLNACRSDRVEHARANDLKNNVTYYTDILYYIPRRGIVCGRRILPIPHHMSPQVDCMQLYNQFHRVLIWFITERILQIHSICSQ